MDTFSLYIIQVNVLFAVFAVIYFLFFTKGTHFRLNRFFLLSGILSAVIIPLIKIPVYFNEPDFLLVNEFTFSDFIDNSNVLNSPAMHTTNQISLIEGFKVIYFAGVLFCFLRIIFFFNHLFKLAKNGKSQRLENTFFILTSEQIQPFSFFNFIFLNEEYSENRNLKTIIEHENVHVKQGHSFDVIIVEIAGIVFWFNPFIYALRKAIRSNHEFLADQAVLQNGIDKIEYLQILTAHSISNGFYNFGSHFKNSTLKSRIIMITKKRSTIFHSLKYVLIIPFIAFSIVAFNINDNQIVSVTFPEIVVNQVKSTFKIPFSTMENVKVSSTFGERMHPVLKRRMMHNGIDFSAKTGTPIIATGDGKIRTVEYFPESYGKHIIVDHANGFSSLYAQLSDYTVNEGDFVKQGEVIGFVGSSGLSTAPHLHFELKKDGDFVNPVDYLENFK